MAGPLIWEKKNNFVIFHPYQKSIDYLLPLTIFDSDNNRYVSLEMKNYVKYLGILIDKNTHRQLLNRGRWLVESLIWGTNVPQHTLLNICRPLILLCLTYGFIVWGQASKTHLTKLLNASAKSSPFHIFCQHECSCHSSFYWYKYPAN